ncbi:MAG: hypothetical protein CL527_09185, partial [Aequorivita sp.]|nr:hypothetical protein [Aequorivita sp.]
MQSTFKTPTLQNLKPYYLLFVFLILATQSCNERPKKVSSQADLPEKETYSVIIAGTKVGHLNVDRAGDTVAIDYDYKDNGRGPTVAETIVLDAAGFPRQ